MSEQSKQHPEGAKIIRSREAVSREFGSRPGAMSRTRTGAAITMARVVNSRRSPTSPAVPGARSLLYFSRCSVKIGTTTSGSRLATCLAISTGRNMAMNRASVISLAPKTMVISRPTAKPRPEFMVFRPVRVSAFRTIDISIQLENSSARDCKQPNGRPLRH